MLKTIAPFFFLGFVGFFFFIWLSIMVVTIGGTIFWIIMLIDLLKRKFPKERENEQLIWVLVIVLTHWLGALIYYFLVKRKESLAQKSKKQTKSK